ncbi:MAG: bifunctional phosphopantothenoylcysteine decarboxylase/phosphopantothenate--cysteine ligase CoaBC [Cyclobacteriaceae bacterium]|nr:bifunctional phosphopantothenoylcysteine decarboxylase/phosphopantothenate--cysteine ligase CoaBC [Cyclobacteriaceae bacterium]
MLSGRKILLGVTGSIAAYKSALLVRLLVKEGAQVQVMMTCAAHDFITPLTLATLSRNPVLTEFTTGSGGTWANHVEWGLWADVMIIAPASANTIARMASGQCDNLMLATWLSARCPVWVAPAMDLDMYRHAATQSNLKALASFGVKVMEPRHGELASGLTGQGRMAEPEEIVAALNIAMTGALQGKRALVTAGPTYEAIDPVRFIGNHSSGKMGFAIAASLAKQGAAVDLVTGPTHEVAQHPSVKVHPVTSASEMAQASEPLFAASDITVLAAAVADYRPTHPADQKIKKADQELTIELTRTIDIASSLGARKRPGQLLVGFALETEHEVENAKSKLKRKNLDLIVLNSLRNKGAGFGYDTNQVTIIGKDGQINEIGLQSKSAVADEIVQQIVQQLNG